LSASSSGLEPVLGALAVLAASPEAELRTAFDAHAPICVARAPGRLDVMGGFADYSGSLTLELPIAEAAYVAVQACEAPRVQVLSAGFGAQQGPLRRAEFPLAELRRETRDHAAACRYFRRDPAQAWAAYVAGTLAALGVEWGCELRTGLSILVVSSVPEGKGVSSSAALEVASLYALAAHHGIELDAKTAALVCQRVENLVVGAPCGVMDQMTASAGQAGQLLALLCQPVELEASSIVPPGIELFGIDSGLRHAVSGADYGQVRVAAFMGYRCICEHAGRPVEQLGDGRVRIEDPELGGYLARLPRAVFEREYRALLPERMLGAEFLQRFGGISDAITQVAPDVSYRVRAATAHPVYEHARAREFQALLSSPELAAEQWGGPRAEVALARLGALMFEAHDSYTVCGLGSSGTDRLVELVREAGAARGLYGAKITGGGSGGTVAVLGRRGAGTAVEQIARRYVLETGRSAYVFSGSSPGAAAFGVRSLWRATSGWQSRPWGADEGLRDGVGM
jgi:galactokinase